MTWWLYHHFPLCHPFYVVLLCCVFLANLEKTSLVIRKSFRLDLSKTSEGCSSLNFRESICLKLFLMSDVWKRLYHYSNNLRTLFFLKFRDFMRLPYFHEVPSRNIYYSINIIYSQINRVGDIRIYTIEGGENITNNPNHCVLKKLLCWLSNTKLYIQTKLLLKRNEAVIHFKL